MAYVFVLVVGLAAGALSGIIGTGSSIMLLPILVYQYGPKQAVPIMAVAAAMANIGKILAWWRDIDWRACAAYSIPGIPAAALGARTLLVLPTHLVDLVLGGFFLAMIPHEAMVARTQFSHRCLATRPIGRCHRVCHRHRSIDRTPERACFHVLWFVEGRISLDGSC